MKLIRLLMIIFLVVVHFNVRASDDSWTKSSWEELKALGCIEVPNFIDMTRSSTTLQLDDSEKWIATGVRVEKDKLLQFEWSNKGITPTPEKYKVLYRIDPRFGRPQVFIQKRTLVRGSNNQFEEKYISDFHQFKNGKLLQYQDTPEMTFLTRIQDFSDYFDFKGRSKIAVKQGDVINIQIDSSGSYFGSSSEMNSNLGVNDDPLLIHTGNAIPDNQIIYSNITPWCADAINNTRPEYLLNCTSFPNQYWDIGSNTNTLVGNIDNAAFKVNQVSINPCANNASGADNNPICYYDKGRGITISVGGTTIKPVEEKFVHSTFTNKDFFYYKSDTTGDLDFVTDWPIAGMYSDSGALNQFMVNWGGNLGASDAASFNSLFATLSPNFMMNFVYFGRYLLDIEIGNSIEPLSLTDLNALKVEYTIVRDTNSLVTPDNSTAGISVDRNFRGNASDSGYLWMKVVRPNDRMTGRVDVKIANYTGSTWFSDVVYNGLVKPLREKFNGLSQIIYQKLVSNATLQNIARSMMVIYIIIYGLMFLAGATQITTTDIVVRVLKIGLIVALFSPTSWEFFSENLFNLFIDGTDYLLTAVVGITSSDGNIFGFVDPVIDKYTNSTIWSLLGIQLLQIHTGLSFFAMMTIYSILTYFRALLEVIVSYCLAFLGLAIMVSLAPLFIILVLFERTKSIFNNWLSVMFSYMLQPTILLIFFLLIDQIISNQISQAVVKSCWDILIPFEFSFDLRHMSIPINFQFTLPFLPGIPFYVPQVSVVGSIDEFFTRQGTFARVATSSLIFFTLCKLMSGLVHYVTLLVESLTNVIAARQDGALQSGQSNPINDIVDNITSPVTGRLRTVKDFVKEKFIDQKMLERKEGKQTEIDYNIGVNKNRVQNPNNNS